MKTWYLLPFVMVLGVMVGRYLPKEELRTSKPAPKPVGQSARNDSLNSLTRMIQIPDRASRPRRAPPPQDVAVAAEDDGVVSDAPAEESFRERRDRRRREWLEREQFSPEDLRARIDEAKDLWATRVEIARMQALDKLGLAEVEHQAFFDDAINHMNESFMFTLQALADQLRGGADLTPELGARVVSELSATMVATYDDLMQSLPPERHGDVGGMELTDFIDPGVIEPLIDVQDKFQNLRPGGLR